MFAFANCLSATLSESSKSDEEIDKFYGALIVTDLCFHDVFLLCPILSLENCEAEGNLPLDDWLPVTLLMSVSLYSNQVLG